MAGLSLLAVCCTAFTVVFAVLAALALAIHLVSLALPVRLARADPAVIAAIAAAVASRHGGARVKDIVEVP